MKDKKQLKQIISFITDYMMQQLVNRRYGKKELNQIITYVLYKHRKEIEKLATIIYDSRETISYRTIYFMLETYIKVLLYEIDKVEWDDNKKSNEYDILGRIPGPIAICKMSPIYANVNKLDYYSIQKEFGPIKGYKSEILECYRDLGKKLGFEDALEFAHFFSHLLWNGYFSPTKTHTYEIRNRIPDYPTLEVFQGKGVCANYAHLLRDYMITCGKEASTISCYVDSAHMHPDRSKEDEIDKKTNMSVGEILCFGLLLLLAKPIISKLADHEMILISEKDKVYYYDPTNTLVLNPEGHSKASIVNGTGEFKINLMLCHVPFQFESIRNAELEMILKNRKFETYEKEEVNQIFNSVVATAKLNEKLLDETYESIKPCIIGINEEIDKHKDEIKVLLTKKKIKEA